MPNYFTTTHKYNTLYIEKYAVNGACPPFRPCRPVQVDPATGVVWGEQLSLFAGQWF